MKKFKGKIVEYSKILNTQTSFGEDTIISKKKEIESRQKEKILSMVHYKYS